jgi:hypothetical protein
LAHAPRSAARWAALACVAPLAACVPAWAVTPMRATLRLASLLAASSVLIVMLHAVAAGRVSGGYGVLASVPLWAAFVLERRVIQRRGRL